MRVLVLFYFVSVVVLLVCLFLIYLHFVFGLRLHLDLLFVLQLHPGLDLGFSNSLIIQQVITKEIITVAVVWKSDLN